MTALGALTRARFRAALRPGKSATCCVRTAASGWSAPGACLPCHYEETPPLRGGRLDYEAGNGRGYTVWLGGEVAVTESDVIVITASPIASDVGRQIQVTRLVPRGNLSADPRVEGTLR